MALLTDAELWHARLGHPSLFVLKKMGLPSQLPRPCVVCPQAKMTQKPHQDIKQNYKPLDRISFDLMGPIEPEALGGHRYVVTAVDAATKACKVHLAPTKDAAAGFVKETISWFEQRGGCSVKAIRTDRGSEFLNKELMEWLKDHGIIHEKTAGYEPQQNGQAERLNRTLMEGTRALLMQSNMPHPLWGEAVRTVAYVRNLVPAKGTGDKSPAKLLTGSSIDLNLLKVWGCKALVHVPEEKRTGKLAPRAQEAVFIGYENSSTYRFLVNGQLVLSRTATFFENDPGDLHLSFGTQELVIPDLLVEPGNRPVSDIAENAENTSQPLESGYGSDQMITSGQTSVESVVGNGIVDITVQENLERTTPHELENDSEKNAEIISESGAEIRFDEETALTDQNERNEESNKTREIESTGKYDLRQRKDVDYRKLALGLKVDVESEKLPADFSGYEKAMERSDADLWKMAVEDEIRSLYESDTWKVADLPAGRKALETKWVFKIKKDATGNVDRYKARLVIKGFQQREGIDFAEIYAPVVSKTALRMFLTVTAVQDLELEQLDIKTAFLNADLVEDIYMKFPEGVQPVPGKVLKLKKSLYGLKQAPRMWNKLLTTTLKEVLDCECNDVEESVLVCRSKTSACFICVYVDDILLASSDKTLLQKVMDGLCSKFDARHLGPAHLFCGMVIDRNRKSRMMHLSESTKIDKMLEMFGMESAKESRVPLSECMKQGKEESDGKLVVQYQQLVGQLLYLSTTVRPDIAHAAAVLSRYMSKPTQEHWKAAKRVLKYLKGTRTHGLCLGQHEVKSVNAEMDLKLVGYCDSDFGTDVDTRRSRTGFLFLLNGSLVSWYSKLQKTVATSTAEAEYMAVSACVKEALWIRNVLGSLLKSTWNEVSIMNDNQATLRMINDLNSVSRSKHIDIQHHFVRERAVRGEVKFHYCPTDIMLADYLTKVLPSSRFEEIRDALHVVKKQE